MNSDSLFNPRSQSDLNRLLLKSLSDPTFIDLLTNNSIKRSKYFSWRRSAIVGIEFIQSRISQKSNYARKMNYLKLVARSCSTKKELIMFSQILAKASVSIKKHNFNHIKKGKLNMIQRFSDTVPMYANSHNVPYVFSSMLCREQHFHMPLYSYWCKKLKENPKLHRKQWEFVYICHSLFERGMLKSGSKAIGFGVGKEPLAPYYSSLGVKILATDLDLTKAKDLGWVTTDQHSDSLESLNEKQICPQKVFEKNTRFRSVDMNDIPADIGEFDFCWSSCAFEHLGSIEKGLNFVKNSCKLLKIGGIAVHTTEFNLTSNSDTLDNNSSFVIFRKKDIEKLSDDLEKDGFFMEEVDFSSGVDELEQYVDLPPYIDEPHLRLELAGKYVSTSIGLIIHRMR